MTDTEILDEVIKWLRTYVIGGAPVAPYSSKFCMEFIEKERGSKRRAPVQPHQHFWKCHHHPAAVDNYGNQMVTCQECQEEPIWYSFGFNQKKGMK